MPRHDPPPPAPIGPQFRRILRWAAALSAILAAIAVLVVHRGDNALHIHLLIATGLGVFLTMLIWIALISLMFLSHHNGHDDAAADFKDEQ